MGGGIILPWLGLAGALAFIVSASRRGASEVQRCTWHVPDPVPPSVVRRAMQLLARADPLGTEYVEEVDGKIYKYRRAMHPPSAGNPSWHPGIDAQECVLPRAGKRTEGCGRCP